MNLRILYLAVCGLILGAVIHICIIFLIPLLGEKDVARLVVNKSAANTFVQIREDSEIGLINGDPFFRLATCKFDLTKSGVEVVGDETSLFWSASVFNARGRVLYSLNQRTAVGNKLRMIVVNPIQMASIRQIQPEELETSIVVETSEQVGFVIVRALERDSSWEPTVDQFLQGLQCMPYTGQS
ncbi:MAG: hypothetical protein AAGA53_01480 [Pseudomonadota bacterium]